jgi:signal transduction histidine kinase
VNLLLNAIEASGPDGHVLVQVEEDESVHIRVTDDGCGIPSDELTRIFEPFVSLRKGGTGLGLFLALNFVRKSGGDVRVRSEPGGGSVFEIVFPAIEGALEPEPAP